MDQKSAYLQKHQVPELIDRLICRLVDELPADPRAFLAEQLASQLDSKYTAKDAMPTYIVSGDKALFPVFAASALTPEVFARLYQKRTANGVALEDLIADGLDHNYRVAPAGAKAAEPITGVIAGDEASFETFAPLIDAVVTMRHPSAPPKQYVHALSLAGVTGGFSLPAGVFSGGCVRLKRNLRGFRFLRTMSRAERRALAGVVAQQLKTATQGNARLAGTSVAFSGSPAQPGLPPACATLGLFPAVSTVAPRASREWPDGRSIFHGGDGHFIVLVGSGEEHLEIAGVATEGCNLRDAFDRAVEGANALNESLKRTANEFAQNERYGFLTSNLDFLGAALVIEVVATLPKLTTAAEWQDVLRALQLTASVGDGGSARIRTALSTLGLSEADIFKRAIAAFEKLADLEARLGRNEAIKGQF